MRSYRTKNQEKRTRIEQDTTKKWWRGSKCVFFGNVAVAKISENGCKDSFFVSDETHRSESSDSM
jgi:hypothetical protein